MEWWKKLGDIVRSHVSTEQSQHEHKMPADGQNPVSALHLFVLLEMPRLSSLPWLELRPSVLLKCIDDLTTSVVIHFRTAVFFPSRTGHGKQGPSSSLQRAVH